MSLVLAQRAASVGTAVVKGGQAVSKEIYGYDFVSLLIKITLFQLLALLIAKYIEFVLGTTNIITNIAKFLGFNVPQFLPQWFVDFYQNGFNGIKYWDVVKGLTIVLLIMEYNNYQKTQKALGGDPQPFTQGVFFLLIGFFVMITIPELVQRFKDTTAMTSTTGGVSI
jgi:hypothetical protein